MAAAFNASIYVENLNDWRTPYGVMMGFTSSQVVFRTLPQPTAYSGVTCNAQIQLLPTAPSTIQPVYYTPLTVAQLVTLASA